ncbi:hypothetical protein Dda_8812 [Drechslerella dactyloides]|uniref:Arrestin-like N-terminal domain-containing protein n=1 Tax=Drechslerella dactyloides TaxID=74499 RepID=A0AAD6NFL6_DREDA|nr:hypothetical protein Dda_8812 [Drechslerella dactyloides]
MPRAGPKTHPAVAVTLDEPDAIFLPGSTVSGTITVSHGYHKLQVRLFGRSKVLIIQSHGEGKDYYRGRASLFDTTSFLDGPPVSQADGTDVWRFAVQIPTHAVSAPMSPGKNDSWKVHEKFLDNIETDVSSHALPGIFYHCGNNHARGQRGECYIEYVLEVSLCEEAVDLSPKKKKGKQVAPPTTVVPLVVRARSTETPIEYAAHIAETHESTRIRTLRLLPQFATENISLKRSIRSVLQPSSVPTYLFDVRVAAPSTVQLDNPSHIPFRLSVVPRTSSGNNSVGSIFDGGNASTLPDVKITAFSLALKMTVMMRARWLKLFSWDKDALCTQSHDYMVAPELPVHMVGYVIPREGESISMDETNGAAGEQNLDLGRLLDLRVSRTHSTYHPPSLASTPTRTDFKTHRPLWPSFKSYNIYLLYQWKYKMTVLCAGGTQAVEGKSPVTLIAQSESQEQDITVDKQGVRKRWREKTHGAEGIGEIAAIVGESVGE